MCTAQAEETKKDAKQSASDHVASVRPSLASMGYADLQDLPGIVVSPEDMFDDRGPGATCNTWSAGALPTTNPNNCQGLFGTAAQVGMNTHFIFSDLSALVDSGGNGTLERIALGAADNFNATATGDVTGICFWGRYLDLTLGGFVPPPSVATQV
ncbi:MAG TPA: hypothetical protein PK308_11385, partial [Phycisphaerales bacterium]|nr:hypothetical protein [Phycisphaerales bacterium]